MQLSPYTQYYVRKLLQQYVENLQDAVSARINIQACTQMNLCQVLSRLYPNAVEARLILDELEALIGVYRMLETNCSGNQQHLREVKQRIFKLLGLRLGEIPPLASIPRVPEQWAVVFRFYMLERVREGIRYKDEFYGLAQQFTSSHLLQAYQLAYILKQHQIPFMFTRSEKRYAIWIQMQSPAYLAFLKQGQKVITMHLKLFKLKEAIVAKRNVEETAVPSPTNWTTQIPA